MNNTDLFDFIFVDRYKEQKILENYLITSTDSTLWIYGKQGFGKTEFVTYMLKKNKKYRFCYINIDVSENSADIISNFIIELQTYSSVNFLETVKRTYKSFYNNIYKKAKEFDIDFPKKITNIVSLLFDSSYLVMTHNDEKKESIDILQTYLDAISEDQCIFICIDNFSRCDIQTANILCTLFKNNFKNPNFKSCIITTTEELEDTLKDLIQRNLPYTSIEITNLDNVSFFYQILEPIYDISVFSTEEIEYIYKKCMGNPKKLSTLISKLLDMKGIEYRTTPKAKINRDILENILKSDYIKLQINEFAEINQWLIYSYLCLEQTASVEDVLNLAVYIAKKNCMENIYRKELLHKALLELIGLKIFSYVTVGKITITYDMDYFDLQEQFSASNLYKLFSGYAYEYLLNETNSYNHEGLLCKHSRIASISKWEVRNFRYAKKLFYKNQIYDSYKVANNLNACFSRLHPVQQLFIAIIFYESGNFSRAIRCLEPLDPKTLRYDKLKYYRLFFMAKANNNIGKVKYAAELLEQALNFVAEDSELYVHTLNLLHMYYFEIPGKRAYSKKLFFKIKQSYKEKYPYIWANTMRGAHNYLDSKEALSVLMEAGQLLNDSLESAYLKTTKGFLYVQMDNLEMAIKQFEDAYNSIRVLKKHEISYVANDLAVCYLMKQQWSQAKRILLEALLWNRTLYGKLAVQTHLMICCLHLEQIDEAAYYAEALENYLEDFSCDDAIVKRKLYINLAIAYKELGNPIATGGYLNKLEPLAKNSSSEWRYESLTNTALNSKKPESLYLSITTFEPWLLVYAHD